MSYLGTLKTRVTKEMFRQCSTENVRNLSYYIHTFTGYNLERMLVKTEKALGCMVLRITLILFLSGRNFMTCSLKD